MKSEQVLHLPHSYPYWQKDIVPLLNKFANKTMPSQKVFGELVQLHIINYSHSKTWSQSPINKFKTSIYSLENLKILQRQTLSDLVSKLAHFLLKYSPKQPIPLLKIGQRKIAEYQRKAIFYLVVLMFFGIIPPRYKKGEQKYKRFNSMNSFAHIFSHSKFKTICILQYLKSTIAELNSQPDKKVVYLAQRNHVVQKVQQLINQNQNKPLNNKASIEDYNGNVKVDFANRFIGGGCLKNGCVQQQIMFAVRPELLAMTLLCQEMQSDQALAFTGFKRHFNSKGYADRTEYAGICKDKYQFSQNNTYSQYIVAIDAVKFKKNDASQFSRQLINREIKKAVAGFSMYQKKAIVSGGWGCGVYNGDFQLKVMIQLIAATITDNELVICPFGRKGLLQKTNILKILQQWSLGDVYDLLIAAAKQSRPNFSLFETMLYLIKRK